MSTRLKADPESLTTTVSDTVKRRMESVCLTEFMQTTEI